MRSRGSGPWSGKASTLKESREPLPQPKLWLEPAIVPVWIYVTKPILQIYTIYIYKHTYIDTNIYIYIFIYLYIYIYI